MYKLIAAVLCAGFLLPSVHAQEGDIETDRPDQTECPYTVPVKMIQLEMGWNTGKNSPSEKEYLLPTLLAKYGISKKMELRLVTTLKKITTRPANEKEQMETGFDPVEIGTKISLLEEKKWLPKTSVIVMVGIPRFASAAFAAEKPAPEIRFTMQHTLHSRISLGYNIGAAWDGVGRHPAWLYTFAPGFSFSEKLYGYIEAFGFISHTESPQHSMDGGVAWLCSSSLKIDVSGGMGISEAAPDWYISLGASIRFNIFR